MPLDMDLAMRARLSLTPRELGVWFNLRTHLWLFGELPAFAVQPRRLAAIAGVGPRSLQTMLPALAPLFDRDEYGRLRDVDLEDERDTRLDLAPAERPPLPEPRQVDPSLSEKRSRSGKGGADARWAKNRAARLQLIDGGRPSINDAEMANGMAKSPGDDMAKPVDLPAGFASVLPTFAKPAGSGSHGLTDRFSIDSEKLERSDRPSEGARADADDGKSSGTSPEAANGRDGKPDRPGMANVSTPPMANTGIEAPPPRVAQDIAFSDTAIVDALRLAGKGKIPLNLLTPSAVAPIRVLIDLGCSLPRDIVPAVAGFVARLNGPLRSWQAKAIREAAIASREHAAREDAARAKSEKLVFVVADTPQWRAWLDHKGKKTYFKTQKNGSGPFGGYFPSEWPPGVDARLYDERLAIAARSG